MGVGGRGGGPDNRRQRPSIGYWQPDEGQGSDPYQSRRLSIRHSVAQCLAGRDLQPQDTCLPNKNQPPLQALGHNCSLVLES